MAEPGGRSRTLSLLWVSSLLAMGVTLIAAGSFRGWTTVLWGTALVAASTIRVPTMSGNRWSMALAIATAAPMLLRRNGAADLGHVLFVFVIWALGRWILFSITSRAHDSLPGMMRTGVGSALFALSYSGLEHVFGGSYDSVASMAIAAGGWFGFETTVWALSQYGQDRSSRTYLWLVSAQDWPIGVSLFVVGALFAIAWPELGGWALLAAFVPFSFAYLAFKRSHAARVTYGQTIRALSRIPEVAGLSPDGHSDRTAALAVAVAQELDMAPDHVTEVEYAARMHDIGRITLNEPNIIKIGFTEDDIARWGSEIIAEAPYLQHVATLVRHQHHPYRRPGEQKDPHLPLASKIIRAASAYDHATQELGFSPLEALEVLHRGAAYDFDPDVVEAVRTVVDGHRAGLDD